MAYQTLTGLHLAGWEIALVRELDAQFLAAMASDQNKSS
ncbi:hypothetical protein KL86PLE_100235 [uncultured Pleomorphomonas sp.]|uniref:Uncharacterized protein n=1 Tax=uncultured Pleomorphomonas sp. TaxID=442121 RepID=A0A212L2B0_9HYPH|nr:hypothetical protein KL86PLE_100235 [uncultured Pleomorphomonas sp.]